MKKPLFSTLILVLLITSIIVYNISRGDPFAQPVFVTSNVENGHGIPLSEFQNHYIMVFDLTSTQEATHDFIHPELTNASISVELKFKTSLTANTEIIFLGEKASTIYIDSNRNVSKNSVPMLNG